MRLTLLTRLGHCVGELHCVPSRLGAIPRGSARSNLRSQQIGEDLVSRLARAGPGRPISEERPQALADVRRQHALEVLERGTAKSPDRRCAVHDRRSAAASAGSTSDSSVNTCARLWLARSFMKSSTNDAVRRLVELVEQPVALPDRTADGDFASDDLEDALAVDADERILRHDGRQRAAALEAHFEARVVEPQQQPVDGALRDADANTRASRRRTANGWLGSSRASVSSPTRSSATWRSARTASSATASHASSGMTCGTSAAGSRPRRAARRRTRSRSRERSARISCISGSSIARLRGCVRRLASSAVAARTKVCVGCSVRSIAVRVVMSSTFREVELDRTVDQVALERVDVTAIQPTGHHERRRRAADGREQDGGLLAAPSAAG